MKIIQWTDNKDIRMSFSCFIPSTVLFLIRHLETLFFIDSYVYWSVSSKARSPELTKPVLMPKKH
jgi:hypothetical protein